ncbi:SubName: Full=Related to alpha/beta hydrolase {ECO:0000313/EMBL:CCA69971.1} [Serendipita indica DSM 11827]|nr:SubName: Full=Related to alpha/beta hydrolase {ECO:0000313/EMBL:CCA69971.1} [Serendipita indica DSM 11827]
MSSSTSLPASGEIPDSFMASLKACQALVWPETSSDRRRTTLRRMSTFRGANESDTTAPMSANARVSQVQLSDKSRSINMLSIQPTTPATTPAASTTVILHGYGAGLGFFSLNLDTLSTWVSKRGQPVYLLDWLGMGRSSRPTFRVTAKHADTHQRVSQAESFFLDALEEWRNKMNIDKMNLVGHSLGAYLVTAYALKYPQHVERLVLLSPAGVNAGPIALFQTTSFREADRTQNPRTRKAKLEMQPHRTLLLYGKSRSIEVAKYQKSRKKRRALDDAW